MSQVEQPLDYPPILASPRLRLTPLTVADADALFAMLANPEVTRHLDIDTLERREQALELLDLFAERREARTEARWGIRLAADNTFIGTASLNDLERHENRAEFGLVIDQPWWKQGYASEALQTALAYAFEVLEKNRVESLIFAPNLDSRRLVERNGFTLEGILREHAYEGGRYLDDAMYSILRREWQGRRLDPWISPDRPIE